MKSNKIDKLFLLSLAILIVAGSVIFISASFGLLTRDGATMGSVMFTQLFIGLILGLGFCYVFSKINYKIWRKYAFYIFLGAVFLNILLLIPGIGSSYGGATRWIIIFGISVQPSEFLKLAFIIYFSAWLSGIKNKITEIKYGIIPLMVLFLIIGFLLLGQPDTDTFVVIVIIGLIMFIVEGGRWRDILFVVITGILSITTIAFTRPYVMERILTFLDPSRDPLGAGYQLQQSLIAIGSGGFWGKGFGQSMQKFNYLPEPIGDSIFAVAGEEFGLIGTLAILGMFLFFMYTGLKIASKTNESFGRLLVVGIVILITVQSIVNIAGILGIIPLGGIPLPFMSHGGTALLFTLIEVGIVMNVSRYTS